MRRTGDLWAGLTSFENLLAAAEAAAMGKRSRPDVAAFLLGMETEILLLQRELLTGSYRPGAYHSFVIREPKRREISAAPFRDRVVHHALTRMLGPIFEKRFSPYSFACRKGLGTHAALRLAREACRRYPFVLKCDIRKYFATMDHAILEEKLARAVKCGPTLELAGKIIAGSNAQEECGLYFPGDDLFSRLERRRGLPLGNQTSQFFANLYLDGLDQFVTRQLRPGAYARYVDDFVLFGGSQEQLRVMRAELGVFLEADRLLLHEGKSRIGRCEDGLSFLGWRIYPDHIRLGRENVGRFARRMGDLERGYAEGRVTWDTVALSVRAWIGHAGFGNTVGLRRSLLGRYAFASRGGGRLRNAAGRFLQQQCEESALG
jgi:RNA-directed DNA polymerase